MGRALSVFEREVARFEPGALDQNDKTRIVGAFKCVLRQDPIQEYRPEDWRSEGNSESCTSAALSYSTRFCIIEGEG